MRVAASGRDGLNEAFVIDRYLDSLLARRPADGDGLSPDLRRTADRLVADLPRYHPSFRFEEDLAGRLAAAASAAASGTSPAGAGAGALVAFPGAVAASPFGARSAQVPGVVIGSVLTSAAISIVGAAFVAWRRHRTPTDPMTRAVRAVARGRIA